MMPATRTPAAMARDKFAATRQEMASALIERDDEIDRPILTQAGRKRLLWERDHVPTLSTTVTPLEVEAAHFEAMDLPWSAAAREALETVIRELAREGVQPGDRRQVKAVAAARASAWLHGAEQVEPEHLELLAHVLWDDPVEQPEKCAQAIARIANPVGMRVTQLLLDHPG